MFFGLLNCLDVGKDRKLPYVVWNDLGRLKCLATDLDVSSSCLWYYLFVILLRKLPQSFLASQTTAAPSLFASLITMSLPFFRLFIMPSTLLKSGQHFLLYCIGATSSTREELTRFITAVSPFHPALKYPWEISNTSLAFLDIKISIEGNGLGTSVHYKPIDSHSYLLYSSSHPSHVNNFIPFSQFLELCHLCRNNSDFWFFRKKSEAMGQFFNKHGYPVSVIQAGHHCAHQIAQQSTLQMAEKENTDCIPFTLTFHPHTTQLNLSFLKTLNYFKTTQRLVLPFHNPQ